MCKSLDVLFLEDCNISVKLFTMSLDRYVCDKNINLNVASSVLEAKELFDTKKHKAAILDWNLPDGEGIEVAQFIRLQDCAIPIVFISARFSDEHIQSAQKFNPRDCMTKKYSEEFIAKLVGHLV